MVGRWRAVGGRTTGIMTRATTSIPTRSSRRSRRCGWLVEHHDAAGVRGRTGARRPWRPGRDGVRLLRRVRARRRLWGPDTVRRRDGTAASRRTGGPADRIPLPGGRPAGRWTTTATVRGVPVCDLGVLRGPSAPTTEASIIPPGQRRRTPAGGRDQHGRPRVLVQCPVRDRRSRAAPSGRASRAPTGDLRIRPGAGAGNCSPPAGATRRGRSSTTSSRDARRRLTPQGQPRRVRMSFATAR